MIVQTKENASKVTDKEQYFGAQYSYSKIDPGLTEVLGSLLSFRLRTEGFLLAMLFSHGRYVDCMLIWPSQSQMSTFLLRLTLSLVIVR